MKLHNTYTNKTEEFKPIEGNKVKMYVCGPTVYDYAHLGHARCYITWDVLYRYLKFKGYEVTYCRNVTDVDDKILKKSETEGKTPEEVSTYWYKSFTKSMEGLNNLKPDIEPFATKTIGEMISIVKDLIKNGYAYESNGDVYFRVKKFNNYGMLSKQPIDQLESGARVEVGDIKEDPLDFALWKKDEKFGYNSPWGVGRPGWHIECSAMSRKYLGKTIDIHAGGADLIFPHHENEIAQSICMNGHSLANYWMHVGRLGLNNEKMSKSLGNVINVKDLIEAIDANAFRLFMLSVHYRQPINYTEENIQLAVKEWQKIKSTFEQLHLKLDLAEALDVEGEVVPEIENLMQQFTLALEDDFNTSNAITSLYGVIKEINKMTRAKASDAACKYALMTLQNMAYIFGFDLSKKRLTLEERELMKAWEEARKAKDFKKADELRAQLQALNVL